MERIREFIEWAALIIEGVTVLLLLLATTIGTLRFLLLYGRDKDAYSHYQTNLGKVLILALEFLVAADIIKTIALEQTVQNVAVLGMLVLVRTFLAWSLTLEIEGRWPWEKGKDRSQAEEKVK